MVAPDEAPPSAESSLKEATAAAADRKTPAAMEAGQTLAPEGGEKDQSLSLQGETSGVKEDGSSATGEGNPGKTLDLAADLFEKGSKAIEDGDLVLAVDCLSQSLEIRVAHYGELAPECALTYYKYGCALLYKSQEEADPLVDVPKHRNTDKDKTSTNEQDAESSKASASDTNQDASNDQAMEEGRDGEEEDDEVSEGDVEESAEADGEDDDSDLDLAWKMLEVARAIVDKNPEDTMEKVNVLSALGEVSAEREDIDTSLNDYLKALSILERLVERDNRRVVELNFRICLVLEVGSRTEEAIPYCQKAIALGKSRLERLRKDSVHTTVLAEKGVTFEPGSQIGANQSTVNATCNASVLEDEAEVLSSILSELESKLEDLQQSLLNPSPVLSEVMKMIASKSSSADASPCFTKPRSPSSNSSQIGVISGGFDSPTISTAAKNGGVTHLGVVGRGVKRATVNPRNTEPPAKKASFRVPTDEEESYISEVTDSTGPESDGLNK